MGITSHFGVISSLPLLLVWFTMELKVWLAHCQNTTAQGCLRKGEKSDTHSTHVETSLVEGEDTSCDDHVSWNLEGHSTREEHLFSSVWVIGSVVQSLGLP